MVQNDDGLTFNFSMVCNEIKATALNIVKQKYCECDCDM